MQSLMYVEWMTFWKGARVFGLPMLWAVTALLMVRSHLADPFDPAVFADHPYGHNRDGDLVSGLSVTLLELAVALAILRPWSCHRSWGRSVVALVGFLPWSAFSLLLCMHAGKIYSLHFLWLAGVVVTLVVCTLWSGFLALESDERPSGVP
ncbi:MAG: hypothetical protein NVSMB1_08440 [Polyangiales bacterium]